jgi:hypothetical protein
MTKLIITGILLMLYLSIQAQDFADIQQYSIPILLNPSFSGSTRGDRLFVMPQSSHEQNAKTLLKFVSHDFYVKKRQIGLAFISGVSANYERNLYSLFVEASLSKYLKANERSFVIPSLTIGFHQPLKEYSVFFYDEITNTPEEEMIPGSMLIRIPELVAGTGILLANYDGSVGVSGKVQLPVRKGKFKSTRSEPSYRLLVHAEKIFSYYHRGLLSREYLFRPRAVLQLGSESLQLFGELMVQRKQFETALGFLPNFDTGNSRLSLNVGYDFKYFKLNYLGSVLNENGKFRETMHTIYFSVIFPELKRFGIPVPAIIRNL